MAEGVFEGIRKLPEKVRRGLAEHGRTKKLFLRAGESSLVAGDVGQRRKRIYSILAFLHC